MNASGLYAIGSNDARLTSSWGAGLHRIDGKGAVLATLVLMERHDSTRPRAISILSPEQAREMALALCQMADQADKANNAAVEETLRRAREGC